MISCKLIQEKNKARIEIDAPFRIAEICSFDQIMKCSAIHMYSCDTLIIEYAWKIVCQVKNPNEIHFTTTGKFEETYSYKIYGKDIIPKNKDVYKINYIRFTKIKDKVAIMVYEDFPQDYYVPTKFNAKKTKSR